MTYNEIDKKELKSLIEQIINQYYVSAARQEIEKNGFVLTVDLSYYLYYKLTFTHDIGLPQHIANYLLTNRDETFDIIGIIKLFELDG